MDGWLDLLRGTFQALLDDVRVSRSWWPPAGRRELPRGPLLNHGRAAGGRILPWKPPALSCPTMQGMLPMGLGEQPVCCAMLVCGLTTPGTRRAWTEEKVACPGCSKVLVAGVDDRPALLRCGSCEVEFHLTPKQAKIEVACPSCDRRLRMNRRPGRREVSCPACDTGFAVNF